MLIQLSKHSESMGADCFPFTNNTKLDYTLRVLKINKND